MGNWSITIVGVGAHHNQNLDMAQRAHVDADIQFQNFVKALVKSGQSITHASFTYGGSVNPWQDTLTAPKLTMQQLNAAACNQRDDVEAALNTAANWSDRPDVNQAK